MTIRHVVSWRLADAGEEAIVMAGRMAKIRAELEALPPVIPEIRALEVGVNAIAGENWDLVLIADFDDEDALDRYVEHPEHQKVSGFIRSVVADRSAVDFEV